MKRDCVGCVIFFPCAVESSHHPFTAPVAEHEQLLLESSGTQYEQVWMLHEVLSTKLRGNKMCMAIPIITASCTAICPNAIHHVLLSFHTLCDHYKESNSEYSATSEHYWTKKC